ncbi:MAG: hypothetical protein IT410_00280 [Candidatus Doudnabacteria bacterium]|nr:hypothetical protein [Candidatus Doudnabacteria bacterium]
MMQASEYSIRDFLSWYNRTSDFNHIEQRKKLDFTLKASVLFLGGGLLLITLYSSLIILLFSVFNILGLLFFLIGIVLIPFIFPYLFICLLVILKILQLPLEWIIIQRGRKIISEHKALKIGIAGSYGKTSMREMLKTVLAESKKVAAPPSSYNTVLGISKFLQTLKGDEDVLLFELGEYYPGDIMRLCKFTKPDLGIVTGINEAHLSKFKSIDKTVATIYEISDWLGQGRPLFVNGENGLAKNNAPSQSQIYSRDGMGKRKVSNATTTLAGLDFKVSNGEEELNLHSNLLGMHHIGPLLVVLQIALDLGLTKEQIVEGVSKTKPFEHRLQPVYDSSGVITLDDSYNGNPDGVKAVIDFLGHLNGHRRFYVTPGLVEMGHRTEEVHKEIGIWLAQAKIEKVVLIKNSVTHFIESGLREAKYSGEIIWFDNAIKAYNSLPNLTVSGDVVLLQNDWPDQYA